MVGMVEEIDRAVSADDDMSLGEGAKAKETKTSALPSFLVFPATATDFPLPLLPIRLSSGNEQSLAPPGLPSGCNRAAKHVPPPLTQTHSGFRDILACPETIRQLGLAALL